MPSPMQHLEAQVVVDPSSCNHNMEDGQRNLQTGTQSGASSIGKAAAGKPKQVLVMILAAYANQP